MKEVVQVLMVYVLGSLAKYIAAAVGQRQLASALRLVTILICISIFAPAVWEALSGVVDFLESMKGFLKGAEEGSSFWHWLFWLGAPKEGR